MRFQILSRPTLTGRLGNRGCRTCNLGGDLATLPLYPRDAMTTPNPDTDVLLDQAERGDQRARDLLLARYRDRLRRMVALRLDRRLAARVDPSDVLQESLAEAAR